ncbi:MAG: hypothetical protein ACRDYY_06765 [Acidimicrobiales bacterium]
MRSFHQPWRRFGVGALLAAIVAYCWFVAGLRPFTVPIQAAVALLEVVVAIRAWMSPRHLRRSSRQPADPTWRNAGPWIFLAVLLALWEVGAYFASPRRDHPTLSSLAGSLQDSHLGRGALILAWLILAFALFLRPARERAASSRP